MKKIKWFLFLAIAVVMLYGLTSTTFADTNITAQHRLVSQAEGANGFDISLSLTIQNSGLESLSDVTLEITDPTVTAEPGTNKLYLASLPSGAQLQANWNIIAVTPLLGAERPLLILGNGTKGSGQSIAFHLISMGVNK
ncbi:MAG: hypothetical protein H8D23_07995 [Candidatus Brocadiales bacterium]|nr:hypothetical protein [Candidatus Brocadiales bacterium]